MRASYLDLIRADRDGTSVRLDLGEWGALQVQRDHLLLLAPRGDRAVHLEAGRLLEKESYLHYALNPDLGRMMLADERGDGVYLLDLRSQELSLIAPLDRPYSSTYFDAGMYRIEFVELEDGVLLVYEGGIMRLAWDGQLRWKHEHDHFWLSFTGVDSGIAWYRSEIDGEYGYRLEDGRRVEHVVSSAS